MCVVYPGETHKKGWRNHEETACPGTCPDAAACRRFRGAFRRSMVRGGGHGCDGGKKRAAESEELLGVTYEPVSYLGSQVVAGVRHCYLCRATVVYPDAEPYLVLVYVLEKTDGSAVVEQIVQLDLAGLAESK